MFSSLLLFHAIIIGNREEKEEKTWATKQKIIHQYPEGDLYTLLTCWEMEWILESAHTPLFPG
jgi:hypothetical protein